MRPPSVKAVLRSPWLPGLLLTVMILFSLGSIRASDDIEELNVSEGENLLHGLAVDGAMSYCMPGASLWSSFRRIHSPRELSHIPPKIIFALTVLLAFSLGRMLHSLPCGLLAALLCCWNPEALGYYVDDENIILGLALLAAANIAAWRALAPNRWRSALLGLIIGSALLIKSSFSVYPILLTGYELIFHRRHSLASRVKLLLPMWAVLILLLAPWIGMNFAIHDRFLLFELGRSDISIASGALGLTSVSGGGNIMKAAGIGQGDNVLAWAAGEVLRHPIRYVLACFRRAWHAARLHPLLIVLGFLSFWLFRQREPHRQVALLAAYYFGIHCLVGTADRFFSPVWPLWMVLTATTIFYGKNADKKTPRMALVWTCCAPVFVLAALAITLVAAYPVRRNISEEALDLALFAHPRDSWLWAQRGRQYMKRRRFGPATRAFGSALKLDWHVNRRLDYQWARGMLGFPIADEIPISPGRSYETIRRELILGASALAREDTTEADLIFSNIRRRYEETCGPHWKTDGSELQEFQKKICEAGEMQPDTFYEILTPLSLKQYSFAIRRLDFMAEGDALRECNKARASLEIGAPAEALRHMARVTAASSLSGGATWDKILLSDCAELYALLGRAPEALRIVKNLNLRFPTDARFWLLRARTLGKTENQSGAAAAMSRVIRKRPKDIEALLEHAAYAEGAGQRDSALRSLRRIEKLKPDTRQLREAARLYEKLGDSPGAARIYLALTREEPENVEFWRLRARTLSQMEDYSGAADAMQEVIRIQHAVGTER